MTIQENAIHDIIFERHRQDDKWGEQNHDPITYSTILMEEVGELAQASLHMRFGADRDKDCAGNLRKEAVHAAAVALAIIECIDRDKWSWSEGHTKT